MCKYEGPFSFKPPQMEWLPEQDSTEENDASEGPWNDAGGAEVLSLLLLTANCTLPQTA